MKLTNFTDYSLRALIYIAVHSDHLCTVKEISESFDISYHHMTKVVHSLAKHDYIITKKGKNGGMSLSQSPNKLNVGDIVRTLEPNFYIVECFNTVENSCNITSICQLKHAFSDAYQAFISELNKYTLADIAINKVELLDFFNSRSP